MIIPVIFVIAPLLLAAFAAIALHNKGRAAKYVAFAGSIVSSAMILYILYLSLNGAAPSSQSYNWFNVGSLAFNISVSAAPLNMLLLGIMAIITPLIFLYSLGFIELPSEQPRFYFEMSVFAASMMLFAMSGNFITMFIAWEMLGITSYLLIGFWYGRERAPAAARKAITTIIIGDVLMLVAILLIGASYGSFEFSTILAAQPTAALYAALVLIALAAFTKSAQFPFHEWLADAMEGPTPVSAFLHSSTMVKAGVFLIVVLLPLYTQAGLLNLLLVVGLVSALLGASNALTERHIKKILAYSTIEDIGLMFVALGLGSVVAAMMLFLVQAFYKATLFMGAGSIMKANDEREDVFESYGSTYNRIVFASSAIGALSLAGVFPISGFFGKAAVEAAAQNAVVLALLLVVELATSIYIFRWLFLPMKKSFRNAAAVRIKMKTLPKLMVATGAILAFLSLAASAAYMFLPGYLGASGLGIGIEQYATTYITAIIGFAIAYRGYRQGHRLHLASTNKAAYYALYNSVIVNKAYLAITKAVTLFAAAVGYVDMAFDKSTYGASDFVVESGGSVAKVVSGQTNLYVLAFVLGILALVIAFVVA